MTLFVFGIIIAAFLGGIIVGAYGHKWIVSKTSSVGINAPTKLP